MGDFLPKVDTQGAGTGPKTKEKMNVTHYYTQNNSKLNENNTQQWAIKGQGTGSAQGQRFMPYSSNTSSVEAISNRLKAQSTQLQQQ